MGKQAWVLVPLLAAASGCGDLGRGGTGEMVVPRDRLRQVEGSTMEELAIPGAATRPATRPTTAPARVDLRLDEVRRMALGNNLELAVELVNPGIAAEGVNAERAAFESVLVGGVDYTVRDTPTASQLTGSQANDTRATGGIRVPLRTGGTVNVELPVARSETDNQFATLNPAYTSDFAASISHPLLRGAGLDVNAHGIRVAFYRQQQSEVQTKLVVIRVLADAERAYWRLYASRRALEVRQKELQLAEAQLDRARRQVQAGAAADVEVVRAESGVADRVEGIIIADNNTRDRERELKRILNDPSLPMGGPTVVSTASAPDARAYEVSADALVPVALARRMEMLEAELAIALEAANVRVARNGMLPLVSVDYTYNVNGLGPAMDDSLRMLGDRNFEGHRLGVTLEVPLGNEAARSRWRSALLSRVQALRTREARAAQIEQEVRAAADQIETNYQRILAAQKRVVLAARVLDLEIRQFNLGLRTSDDVLEAQTNLAAAQLAEISAVTEYQVAQIDIAYATGTLLGASRVTWTPVTKP